MKNELTLEQNVTNFRVSLKKIWEELKSLWDLAKRNNLEFNDLEKGKADKWEVIANLTLAYRHTEDAIMRLWKVFQALDWWESIYDKKVTPEDARQCAIEDSWNAEWPHNEPEIDNCENTYSG